MDLSLVQDRSSVVDARSKLVQLTAAWLKPIDRAIESRAAYEQQLLASIEAADLAACNARPAILLTALEPRK
jgi:hypothetical protein